MEALRIFATNNSSQASKSHLSRNKVGIITALSLLSIVFNKFSILFNKLPRLTGTLANISTTEFLLIVLLGILTVFASSCLCLFLFELAMSFRSINLAN